MPEFLRKHRHELGLVVAIVAVIGATVLTLYARDWYAGRTPSHVYATNPTLVGQIILRETALLGIFALGAGAVIIAGGIDLSAGSVIAFSGTLFFGFLIMLAPDDPARGGQPLTDDLPLWIPAVALLGVLVAGFLVGSFHTWLITVVELPPFVATLASLVGLRSLARLLIENMTAPEYGGQAQSTINVNDEFLTSFGRERWWIPCVILVVLAIGMWLLLGRTVIGRHVYAMGGNEEAARLSGIRVHRLKWLVYCISSMTAALAGVLYACYIGTTSPATDGMGYELNAIAAAVVGGCSLSGGLGSIAGVLLGALFLRSVIDSVAKLFGRSDLFEGIVVGALVVLAVAFSSRSGERGRKDFFPGPLGLLTAGILVLLAGTLAYVTFDAHKPRYAAIAAGVTALLVGGRVVYERVLSRRG